MTKQREKARNGAASHFSVITKIAENRCCFDPPSSFLLLPQHPPPNVHRRSPAGQAPASSFHRPPSSSCRYQTLTSKSPEKGHLKHDVLPSKGRAPTPTAEPALPLFSRPRRPGAREGPRPADPGPAHSPGEAGPDPDPGLGTPDPDPGHGTRPRLRIQDPGPRPRARDTDRRPRPPTRTPTPDPGC